MGIYWRLPIGEGVDGTSNHGVVRQRDHRASVEKVNEIDTVINVVLGVLVLLTILILSIALGTWDEYEGEE